MRSLISLCGLAIAVFVSTNVDGLFVLLGFFSDRNFQQRHVVLGEYLGMLLLFTVSVVAAMLSGIFPANDVGWLGLIPVAIGCKKIFDLRNEKKMKSGAAQVGLPERGTGSILTVAVVNIANGGDNIGVYTPQFAIHSGPEIALMGLVFVIMTGIWCLLARGILEYPALKAPIRNYGHRVVPFLLIALGALTLYEGGIFKSFLPQG